MAGDQPSDMFAMLTQGSLVRVNRSTFELEPWLAEKWESSADGLTHTLHLRQGVTWSDGTPFTSADVLFTLQAMYDPKVESVVASSVMPGGKPIQATAPDASTVVLTYAAGLGIGDLAARHVPDPAEAQARERAKGRDLPAGLEHGDGSIGDRRHRSIRAARVQAGRAPRLRSQPDLLAHRA